MQPATSDTPRLLARFVLGFAIMAAVLFGTAGTLAWPGAWLYLCIQIAVSGAMAVWLRRHNPDLLAERMTFMKSSARGWDRAILLLSTVAFVPYLALPGLDAVRFRWSDVPWPVEALGLAGVLAALLLVARVMRENPYLYRIVEIRADRGHRVVSTGPYRVIRHPMYAGVIIMLVCLPLALGSLWTLVPGAVIILLLLVRTVLEDRVLQAELAGYRDYAARVRYRLLPGIW